MTNKSYSQSHAGMTDGDDVQTSSSPKQRVMLIPLHQDKAIFVRREEQN